MSTSTIKRLTAIALRILAIYLLVTRGLTALKNLFDMAAMMQDQSAPVNLMMPLILNVLLHLGIIIWLWYKAEDIAAAISPNRDSAPDRISIDVERFQTLAFSTVGLVITAKGIPTLIQGLYQRLTLPGSPFPAMMEVNRANSTIVLALIQVALGVFLLFGTQTLIAFLKSARRSL